MTLNGIKQCEKSSMVDVYKDIITDDDIASLLEYFRLVDDRTDSRPDVVSKHPHWDKDHWPQGIIKRILNQVLDKEYLVEEVIFNHSKISFGLHADSGVLDQPIYKAILIPLEVTANSGTAFFNNHWLFPSAKFTRQKFNPLDYTVFDCDNNPVKVNLKEFLQNRNLSLFSNYTDAYIKNLIETRLNNTGYTKTDVRTNQYEKIKGYDPKKTIDQKVYNQHLNHIVYDDLQGLSLDQIVPWVTGEAIVFDRTQLHCATSGHTSKTGITIFTDLV